MVLHMAKHSEDSTCVGVAVENVYQNAHTAGEPIAFNDNGETTAWGAPVYELAARWVEDGTSPCYCD